MTIYNKIMKSSKEIEKKKGNALKRMSPAYQNKVYQNKLSDHGYTMRFSFSSTLAPHQTHSPFMSSLPSSGAYLCTPSSSVFTAYQMHFVNHLYMHIHLSCPQLPTLLRRLFTKLMQAVHQLPMLQQLVYPYSVNQEPCLYPS